RRSADNGASRFYGPWIRGIGARQHYNVGRASVSNSRSGGNWIGIDFGPAYTAVCTCPYFIGRNAAYHIGRSVAGECNLGEILAAYSADGIPTFTTVIRFIQIRVRYHDSRIRIRECEADIWIEVSDQARVDHIPGESAVKSLHHPAKFIACYTVVFIPEPERRG